MIIDPSFANWRFVQQLPVPQGWQCPVCHRVYSPSTSQCTACPAQFSVQSATTLTLEPCPSCWKNPCEKKLTGCGSTVRVTYLANVSCNVQGCTGFCGICRSDS